MCTIVVLHRVHADYPLVVAANRDELYRRQATPPALIQEDPPIVAGLDGERGGTWLGATRAGFFVGVTNQRTYVGADRSLRSRGEVARAALKAGSVRAVRAYMKSIDASAYNSFNLIYGDVERLEVAYARFDTGDIKVERLEPGVHVLCNDRIGSPEFPKAERAGTLAATMTTESWPDLGRSLSALLADHKLPPEGRVPDPPPHSPLPKSIVRRLQALCIHTPAYGTVSSTILAVDGAGLTHYLYAAGPPCKTTHQPVDFALSDI